MMRYLFYALLLVLLPACSGGGSASVETSKSNSSGAASAPGFRIVDNEDLSAGLKGVDGDGNGIRDDIDRLIADKYSASRAMRKAAEQKARALQKFMEATNRKEALIAGDELSRSSECVYRSLPHATPDEIKLREQISKEIEALTANTKERFEKYWQSNEMVGGAVFLQPEGAVCE